MPRDNNSITAKGLANALGATRRGRGWKCHCPAHEDKKASLNIDEGDDGRILLKCRAHCDQEAVMDALRAKGLWGGNATAIARSAASNRRLPANGAVLVDVVPAGAPSLDLEGLLLRLHVIQRRGDKLVHITKQTDKPDIVENVHRVRRFDVRDRKNNLLYVEARIEYGWQERKGRPDKTHRPITLWRQPDGRLEWKAKGYRKPGPLYGLEGLNTDTAAPVVIHEGPSKVEAGRQIAPQFIHLALMGGGEKAGHADVSVLKDLDVVLWPDADETGEKATSLLRQRIDAAGARSVCSVTPPAGVAKGWGIDDLAGSEAAGDDAEALIIAALEGAEPAEPAPNPAELMDLGSFLSATSWLGRILETPEPLLGEVITNTTRMFLGGPTGLGKTHVGFGMAGGMATGTGFLHWKASRAARVLYLDGEMSRDLVQERLADLARRFDVAELPNLYVLCAEDREEIAARWSDLGEMKPLNTPEGQAYLLKLIDLIGGVDIVFLDNRMSLLSGDMKEEQPWSDTMPLVKELTRRRIAQVWIDHTGHDTGRIYGTKTKEWQFDVVGLMEKADRPGADIAFSLKFDKARRRKPSNRHDFDMFTATLVNDEWDVEGVTNTGKRRKVQPMAAAIHGALLDALVITPTPGMVTRDLLYAECVRLALADPIHADDSQTTKDRKRSKLRKYIGELKAAGWIGVNGETVRNLTAEPTEPHRTPTEPAEPLPNRAEPAVQDDITKATRDSGFSASDPVKSAEPTEPLKKGCRTIAEPSEPNQPNYAEPLPNHSRTIAEPLDGTRTEPPNPVSIDGFGSSVVRQTVRQAFKEADQARQILESADRLLDLSERLAKFDWLKEFKPVAPEYSGLTLNEARLLQKVEA